MSEIRSNKVLLTVNTTNDLAKPHSAVGRGRFSGGTTWVGERGPELVTLPRGSGIHTQDRLRGAGNGGGSDFLGTVAVELTLDGKTIQTKLLKLKRTNGGTALGLA